MKKLLLLTIVAICGFAWRSPELMRTLGLAGSAQASARQSERAKPAAAPQPISVQEFAQLNKSDAQAYRKFINSYQVEEERSEVDKLMNFLARGKYE